MSRKTGLWVSSLPMGTLNASGRAQAHTLILPGHVWGDKGTAYLLQHFWAIGMLSVLSPYLSLSFLDYRSESKRTYVRTLAILCFSKVSVPSTKMPMSYDYKK